MTELAPLANASKAFEAFQESQATAFEFQVPADWRGGMLLAATVVGSLARFGEDEFSEMDFLLAFARPSEMPQGIFKMLQAFEESLEEAVARGEDCLNASMGLHGEVARLLDEAPWTLHPVHGCVRIDEVDELDRKAAGAATRAQAPKGKRSEAATTRPVIRSRPARAPVSCMRAAPLATKTPATSVGQRRG